MYKIFQKVKVDTNPAVLMLGEGEEGERRKGNTLRMYFVQYMIKTYIIHYVEFMHILVCVKIQSNWRILQLNGPIFRKSLIMCNWIPRLSSTKLILIMAQEQQLEVLFSQKCNSLWNQLKVLQLSFHIGKWLSFAIHLESSRFDLCFRKSKNILFTLHFNFWQVLSHRTCLLSFIRLTELKTPRCVLSSL